MTVAIESCKTVGFTQMKDGTREDYALLDRFERQWAAGTADRILQALRALDHSIAGYQVSRLEHSLQTATRAHRDGADVDWVVAALLHDLGDELAPYNHDALAAAILEPYVREEVTWVIRHHGLFQRKYYAHHMGGDPDARERYRGHPHYRACVDFCEHWDQASFDPDYDSLPLEAFAPMVREVFARTPWGARDELTCSEHANGVAACRR
jgi:predicted HD phosphohydrolase